MGNVEKSKVFFFFGRRRRFTAPRVREYTKRKRFGRRRNRPKAAANKLIAVAKSDGARYFENKYFSRARARAT